MPEYAHCMRRMEHRSSALSHSLCALAAAFGIRLYLTEQTTMSLEICTIAKRKPFLSPIRDLVNVITNGSLRKNVRG